LPGASAASAFTLVELLIVIALSALLLALLFGPIVQGFRLTNRARAMAAAQDATRFGLEQLARELRQASYVFDNTNTPVALPLEAPDNILFGSRDPAAVIRKNTYQTNQAGQAIVVPLEAFGKIDFIPSGIRTEAPTSDNPGPGIDPTTGRPVGGGQLRLSLAPGTRYVRYWIGLRRNFIRNSDGTISPAFYSNVYEFPRTDDDLNPFVMWRAEYEPNDPNLISQTLTAAQQTEKNAGGINDPNFFYNTTKVGPNGKTFAENWRAIANPVVSGTNLDLLAWRRNAQREINTASPYQSGVSFVPSTVVGDTATPGFLSAAQAEAPAAVPTLYTTQYGQWTLPFTVTVYRASTQHSQGLANTDPRFGLYGTATLRFAVDDTGALLVTLTTPGAPNTLGLNTDQSYYWMRSVSTGRIFVKLPNLAFWVDPSRGRIETGLPPLAAEEDGTPLMLRADSSGPVRMTAGAGGNEGELAEMFFSQSTLHPSAGQQAPGTDLYVPLNQGILFADLASLTASPVQTDGEGPNYYVISDLNTPRLSPFVTFGGANNTTLFQGAMLVPGSERVTGPDNLVYLVDTSGETPVDPNISTPASVSNPQPTDDILYSRVPAALSSIAKQASVVKNQATGPAGVYVRRGPLTYQVRQNLANYKRPYLLFDTLGEAYDSDPRSQEPLSPAVLANPIPGGNPPGLPAGFAGMSGSDREIRVTYLWQNNYARAADGRPTDASGRTEVSGSGNADIRPEPDVVKVDYSTRALINVGLAVRVYDSSSGQPQTSQVNDKIRVSNVGR
jgi:type II secretory pathway pseudopilin PulG